MSDFEAKERIIGQTFERILREQMQGIPLLNERLRVETLGFQEWRGRVVGIVITPWLMNLVMLPGEGDDWESMELGDKQPQEFPSTTYRFMVNEIDGIGRCQTHSLYSPMHEFLSQEHALAAARGFLDTLMVERERSEEERVDKALLGRILRGEEVPEVELAVSGMQEREPEPPAPCAVAQGRIKARLTRRDLLRGALVGEA
ncbi:MAG: [NiFe]-hydrogenase assembly chaperone HybE [gamma proteobacterium symbiont of Phacoides pectinatus]